MTNSFETSSVMTAVSILSAMITPALLITACGSLVQSTSTRLGRVVDRVRVLSHEFEQFSGDLESSLSPDLRGEKHRIMLDQLNRLTIRVGLLQRSLTGLYLAIAIFVATSVSIGLVEVTHARLVWVPVVLGLTGAMFLLYGSVVLIYEARLAVASTLQEMNFLRREITARYPLESPPPTAPYT